MSQDLIEATHGAEMAAKQTLLWSGGAALVALALTLLFAGALARGIIYPIRRITDAMNRLAAPEASVGTVEIADHGRGDEIGEMARATLVFRDNLIRIAQAEERLKSAVILRLHHKALEIADHGRGDEIGEMARATLVFRDNLIRIAQAEERLKSAVILRLHHKAL